MFFIINTSNFFATGSSLWQKPSIFTCLYFFIAAAVLRKPCQEYFKDPARVGLAVLKNIVIFWKFRNGSVKLFGNTSEENWFLIFYTMFNAAKTWSYGLKILENLQTKDFFQSKAFFHLRNFFHTSCFSAFKLLNFIQPLLTNPFQDVDKIFLPKEYLNTYCFRHGKVELKRLGASFQVVLERAKNRLKGKSHRSLF